MISHLSTTTGRITEASDDAPNIMAFRLAKLTMENGELRARLIASETERRLLRSRVDYLEEWVGNRARASEGL